MDRRNGFIHDELEIKVLILYVLRRLPAPVDLDGLAEAAICDDGISYFVFADCLADLIQTGHVVEIDYKYLITEKGIRNAQITESSLPYTVRVKAGKNAEKLSSDITRDLSIKTSHIERSDGCYTVSVALSDGQGQIFSMSLLTTTEEECITIERRFRARAEAIYGEILEMMLFKDKK